MKITDVKTYIAGNPWKNWVFAKVETDEDVHGIGEGTLNGFAKTVEAGIHELKRYVIGEEAFKKTIKAVPERFAWKSIHTDDFRKIAEEFGQMDLRAFFIQWIEHDVRQEG